MINQESIHRFVAGVLLCICSASALASGREAYPVANIASGSGTSMTHDYEVGVFVPLGQRMFFWATNSTSGRELYVTSRIVGGATLVKDIASGSTSGNVNNITAFSDEHGSYVYFSANDGTNGNELWRSDGTLSGTQMVCNLYSGSNSSDPSGLTVVDGALYFSAKNSASDPILWRLADTQSTTPVALVSEVVSMTSYYLTNCTELTEVNGALYLSAKGTRNTGSYTDTELWRVSGTSTAEIDITGSASNSNPSGLVAVGNELYCFATVSSVQYIYQVNGTTKTQRASVSAAANSLTSVDGTIYYADGSLSYNTQLRRLASSGPSSTAITLGSSYPQELTAVGTTLFFSAQDTGSGTYGRQLHKVANSDTSFSENGTRWTTLNSSNDFIADRLSNLPTHNGPFAVDSLGRIYFVGTESSVSGIYMYESGVVSHVAQFLSGDSIATDESPALSAGGDLYFPATDSGLGIEPWVLTSGSTMPIKASDGSVLACFYSNGDVALTGLLYPNATTELADDVNAADFLIKDSTGDIVARIDDEGNLYLAGTASTVGSFSPTGSAFVIKGADGNTVLLIDSTGDLQSIGSVFEQDKF